MTSAKACPLFYAEHKAKDVEILFESDKVQFAVDRFGEKRIVDHAYIHAEPEHDKMNYRPCESAVNKQRFS